MSKRCCDIPEPEAEPKPRGKDDPSNIIARVKDRVQEDKARLGAFRPSPR